MLWAASGPCGRFAALQPTDWCKASGVRQGHQDPRNLERFACSMVSAGGKGGGSGLVALIRDEHAKPALRSTLSLSSRLTWWDTFGVIWMLRVFIRPNV